MSENNDGRVQAIDEKPLKSKQKDRQEPTVGKHKKTFKYQVFLIILLTITIVFIALYFIFSGDKKVTTVNMNTKLDKAIVIKEDESAREKLNAFISGINKRQAQIEADKQAEDERIKAEALAQQQADAQRQAEEARKKAEADEANKDNTTNTVPIVNSEPSNNPNNPNDQLTPHERRLVSNVMPAIDIPPSTNPPANNANQSLDSKSFAQGFASTLLRNKRDLLLIHGTNIPCALRTEIVSTYNGLVTCSVINDVYSANGHTLLVEKGSNVFGTQSIALTQGQARVFVTWSDITTPQGVSIQIDSLGTGRLGASGVGAWVDNHFKERFGGAILLAFLDDAFATVANSASKSSSVSTENTQDNVSDMASTALENSINIPPTGYVPIGTRLNILVARDIDMSNVYRLQPIR
ncbi:hypothetical protein GLP30_17140 [Photobacterium phosphoreum]|uniref:Conjugal transfer protein n=1 Tax=Photobacterium phosphoreum TaxID=659 RepID=A0AAW5A1G1_PHOPO|nr:type IV secretion system protein VirB10 [Photobacterium phosphoreum]MCD9492621.1 hypothetical protein [Photobacterium phosphoreum]MCF2191814.1 hypothetical protein [Photobacterium phosphoreum]MCF2303453.1 hypothetical protein [Photobacterium phosphoreum]